MDSPPELWAFVIANSGVFVTSGLLAGMCLLAHRQSGGATTYRDASVGFGFVLLGGLADPVYQLFFRGSAAPAVAELLWIEAAEAVLLTVGLGLLFLAIVRHGSGDQEATHDLGTAPELGRYEADNLLSDD